MGGVPDLDSNLADTTTAVVDLMIATLDAFLAKLDEDKTTIVDAQIAGEP